MYFPSGDSNKEEKENIIDGVR